jgi:predicted transcriptional regulator
VILIDYLADDEITVTTWPGCGLADITKQDVIDMSMGDGLFPAKTSKHTIASHMPPIHILLEELERVE